MVYKRTACLVVDDEPAATMTLKHYIHSLPFLELAGMTNNAIAALSIIQQRRIDVMFLDIRLPGLSGTDFVRTLYHPPQIIFTTSYRKYAIEAFELGAVDYLLKPVSYERFLKAINKLPQAESKPSDKSKDTDDDYIVIRADRKIIKQRLDDIMYLEALRDYVKIVTKGKAYITKQSLTALENLLPHQQFLRIHRSYIISLKNISSFTSDHVEIYKKQLPISRMYRYEAKKYLTP